MENEYFLLKKRRRVRYIFFYLFEYVFRVLRMNSLSESVPLHRRSVEIFEYYYDGDLESTKFDVY